jgi:peptidoglycan/xylan/chitin deacetylase (PgdA/CDA1 family)
MTSVKWPNRSSAAVTITMDNMGEAAELLRGSWPEGKTIGLHYSVTNSLPAMLSILEETGLSATYFIEGWNTGVYSGAIQAIRNSRHEVAFHGWQHEPWSMLDSDQERDLFDRSISGFSKLSLKIAGFRPPGGVLTEATPALLKEFGMTYCSPAGRDAAIVDDMVYLPFDWLGIDAYYYSEGFSGLRKLKGDSEAPLSPGELEQRFFKQLDELIERGGYTALLFHPFLEIGPGIEPEREVVMRRILARVAADDRIWCATCRDVDQWVRSNPETFEGNPWLDLSTWSR